ncbi:pentapeptide repeat-containing protein [Pleurocapsa sp. PCC 7319]|uniref:pentapeptide repeat-containing protein n=1 Tax=Pleurocapsa sp. PCC 7319 TaxID=118161 RepID=UPI0003463D67|nr:pentapeptide repeat-containing protein [Pleurocapsa sp. PCC 7319]
MILSQLKQRLLNLLIIIAIAVVWVLLKATPAIAQDSAVNYTYSEIRGQDFSHKDLVGAVFAAADARGASFEESDVSNSILTKGIFVNTNLKGANFTSSLMDRVDFNNSDLTNAIFRDAVATSTNFEGTTITGADFSDAILDRYQIYLMCQRAEGTNPTTGVETRYSLGCRD